MQYFLAGGAVRDILIGIAPKDFDYVFSGHEKDFLSKHPEAKKLGHGPAYELHKHEISPLGKDIKSNIRDRDFTINTLLLSEDGILHMHPTAIDDLRHKRIHIASPHSLQHDPTRVFRAARFYAELTDFTISPETIAAMEQAAKEENFKALPPERVGQELIKALESKKPGNFLRALEQANALNYWFEELVGANQIPAGPPEYHKHDVLEHIAGIMDKTHEEIKRWLKTQSDGLKKSLKGLSALTIWMALCHDLGKVLTPADILPHHYMHEIRGVEAAATLAKRLKLSTRMRSAGCLAARLHMKAGIYQRLRNATKVDMLMEAWTKKLFIPLFLVAQADSAIPDLLSIAERDLQTLLAVKLSQKWVNKGAESGRHLREMRCAALASAYRKNRKI